MELKFFPKTNQQGNKIFIKDSDLEEDTIELSGYVLNSISPLQFLKLKNYYKDDEKIREYLGFFIYSKLVELYYENNIQLVRKKLKDEEAQKTVQEEK